MMEKRLQMLVSAVNKDPYKMAEQMNIQTDAVMVDQLISSDAKEMLSFTCNRDEETVVSGNKLRILYRDEKGVGRSRNAALDNSDHEIVQFADDDIVYLDGYADRILAEFDAHSEADILLFNVKAQAGRETYWNNDFAKVTWKNYGRYPAYAICARRDKLVEAKVRYSLLFGGGAPYMNGEDSLFLHDCLKSGLNIYRTTVEIGHELGGESTWFRGFTEKFFFDRGVLYHFLYGPMAGVFGLRFLVKNRTEMCRELGLFKCYKLLLKGIRHGKGLKKD